MELCVDTADSTAGAVLQQVVRGRPLFDLRLNGQCAASRGGLAHDSFGELLEPPLRQPAKDHLSDSVAPAIKPTEAFVKVGNQPGQTSSLHVLDKSGECAGCAPETVPGGHFAKHALGLLAAEDTSHGQRLLVLRNGAGINSNALGETKELLEVLH